VTTLRGGRGPRIALASCTEFPRGLGGETDLPELLAERGGAEAVWAIWDDPAVDWGAFDLVVVRCTWDYPEHLDAFRAWVQATAMTSEVVNPPRIILGNLHKGYLSDLGPDAVPTIVVPAGMTIDLDALGWPSVVVKPAVAVGGNGAVRGATQHDLDALTLAPRGAVDVVVQPYLDRVERDGETSIVCLDGQPTHAVRKKPAVGEFRIHEHRGGTAELIPLQPDLADLASRILDRLPLQPAIARVDLLPYEDRAYVMELELVEPYLWLELAPAAAYRLADSLVRRADLARRSA
jgi:glutathione synthase/RimK-type ligase-like ATP-grasp enzyme